LKTTVPMGAPGAPPLTLVTVVVALGVALAVALASTLVPAIRAARMSTVSALADTPRPPRRRDSLIRLSRKLPVPALFGLRLVARRPRRAIFSAASIAVAVMGLVAALAIHAAVGNKFSHFGSSGGLVSPDVPRAEQVLTAITISLVTLAALTAIFAATATVLDARRASAVTLALGATPQQVRAGLVSAGGHPALPGAIVPGSTRHRPVQGRGPWPEWPRRQCPGWSPQCSELCSSWRRSSRRHPGTDRPPATVAEMPRPSDVVTPGAGSRYAQFKQALSKPAECCG
jgi:hypothetical protein